jgi:filamentous hemagglutinin
MGNPQPDDVGNYGPEGFPADSGVPNTGVMTSEGTDGVGDLFEGRTAKASELKTFAEQQGWEPSQSGNGPLKYVDENGVTRLTIKQGSSRAPGSDGPHVELRDASGQRIDPAGNPVSRNSPGNHTPIDFDL